MGALSIGHILAVVAVVTLLFGGRGRISGIMGDAAQGLRAFREGLKDEATPEAAGRADESGASTKGVKVFSGSSPTR
jgi:sec-independent protein translocase protein TatA